MKKFLDLTHDEFFMGVAIDKAYIPSSVLKQEEEIKLRLFEKIKVGFKAEKYPYIYFFDSLKLAHLSLYFHLMFTQAVLTGKNQFLFPAHSSKSVLDWARQVKKTQMQVQLVAQESSGRLSLSSLDEKLCPKSLVFSQRLFHPILGIIDDQMAQIGSHLSEKGVLYHVDITEFLGEKLFDLESLTADFVSFNLASIDASFSGGVLFSKTALHDLIIPAKFVSASFLEQFVAKLEHFYETATQNMLSKITLKMRFKEALKKELPQVSILMDPLVQNLSTVVLHIPGVHQEALAYLLLSKHIGIDLGGGDELSLETLLEMLGWDKKYAKSCLSLSLKQEVLNGFLLTLSECITTLQKGAL